MTPLQREQLLGNVNLMVKHCTECNLHNVPDLPVPGVGVVDADLFVLAEAAGAVEADPKLYSEFGEPLVGPAGQALQENMVQVGLLPKYKGRIFRTNVLKHHPPGNRPPTAEQKAACMPYLVMQLTAVRPKVILALGKHASTALREIGGLPPLPEDVPHRGQHFELQMPGFTAKVFSAYHPSYAFLRNPQMGPYLVQDLRAVLACLDGGS